MRAFVTGATGVLGSRVVHRLVEDGWEVTGAVHSTDKAAPVQGAGAIPVVVDLFDAAAVADAVAGHDVVCNLATSIPVGPAAGAPGAWDANDRIRREASRNLVDGALAAGVGRYVQESIVFLYADGGDRVLDEAAPIEATGVTRTASLAEAQAARFADAGHVGVVLRFGQLYGPDSGHTIEAIEAVRAGQPVEVGPETAYRSPVTTDDAAEAVVAGLDARSGLYNVVDDQPLRRSELVDALAQAFGVPSPTVRSVTPELPPELSAILRSQRVSNRRFREETGWRPASPSAWEGWRMVAAGTPAPRPVP